MRSFRPPVKYLLIVLFLWSLQTAHANAEWFVQKNHGLVRAFSNEPWQKIHDPTTYTVDIPQNGGTFWLKTEVFLNSTITNPTNLNVKFYPCADEIYWDGVLIGSSGFSENAALGTKLVERSYLIPSRFLNAGKHALLIKMYKERDSVHKLLMSSPQLLDFNTGTILKERDYVRVSDLPLISSIILLWLGCYFFLFHIFHRTLIQYLYFSISSTLVGVYLFFDAWKLLELGFSPLLVAKCTYVSGIWAIYFLCRFFRILLNFPKTKLDRAEIVLSSILGVMMLLAPTPKSLEFFMVAWFPLLLFNVAYFAYHLLKSALVEKGARHFAMFGAYLLVLLTVSYDMYVFINVGNVAAIFPYAFLLFGLGVAYWLTRDYGAALSDRNAQSSLIQKSKELETSYHSDSLTKLNNRRSFDQFMNEKVFSNNPATRSSVSSVCLAVLDVDYFKVYNDTYGHPAGDRLLMSLGWLFSEWKTSNDLVYRIGGEEFAIVMLNRTFETCAKSVERLRQLAESFPFDHLNGNGQHVTVSAGVALLTKEITSAEELYKVADRRLYLAKKNRNKVVFSDFVEEQPISA